MFIHLDKVFHLDEFTIKAQVWSYKTNAIMSKFQNLILINK